MTARVLRSLVYATMGMTVFVGVLPRMVVWAGADLFVFGSVAADVAGMLVVGAGAWMYVSCVWDFVTRGRGTPAFWDPPRTLVARRLFLFTRNPMYIAVAMINVGQSLIVGSLGIAVYAVALALGFHCFVVLYEEPRLSHRFGGVYAEYKRRVPRWLPRVADGRRHPPGV